MSTEDQAAAEALVGVAPEVLSQIARKANRETIKFAVQKYMFCDFTGSVLDVRRAVLVESPHKTYIVTTTWWDKVKDSLLAHPSLVGKVKVIDGRDHYTASGRAKR